MRESLPPSGKNNETRDLLGLYLKVIFIFFTYLSNYELYPRTNAYSHTCKYI